MLAAILAGKASVERRGGMNRRDRISRTLTEAFRPQRLEVVDESEHHKGHAGWREGGETHFRIRIVSPSFTGHSRVSAHRLVNEALAGEFAGGLHALSIEARADSEE
jgi:BolA protein